MTSLLTDEREQLRLEELLAYEILDTEEERPFNDLVELAAIICGCPIGGISFVDDSRQWFKARKNLRFTQAPLQHSFCSQTILQNEVLVVPDALIDARFSEAPLVTDLPHVRFYAGAPIRGAKGFNLGSLFVMDDEPLPGLSPGQLEALEKLSRQITHLLDLKIRNKMIIRQAESLVEVEKKITRLVITEQESERKFIAHELHENFAQTLAAIKLYIEFAEQSQETSGPFIQKSKDNLVQMIHDLRNLSNSMVTGMGLVTS